MKEKIIIKQNMITQIGSLPYEDTGEAVEYSLKHDIPFLPELPKRGDLMLDYIKSPGKLSCLDEFKKHKYKTVKIQCIGPATLILNGYSKDEAVKRVNEHLTAITENLYAEKVVLFLDEPSLWQADFNYQELWAPLFSSFDAVSGIHTCGNMNWDDLFDSDVKIISFDASRYDITKCRRYRAGKNIAWGLEKREDVKDFQEGDLLTLPCGMGPLSYVVKDCEKKWKKLVGVADSLIKNI